MYYVCKVGAIMYCFDSLSNFKKILLLVLWIYALYYERNYYNCCYKIVLKREIERRYKEKEGAIFIKADNLNIYLNCN